MKDVKVLVVGPSWYGNWVDYFYDGLIAVGADAEVIHTNTLFGNTIGYGDSVQARLFGKLKQIVFNASPLLFRFFKGLRRALSERDLLKRLRIAGRAKTTFVVFIWTPPSVWLLKKLKKIENTKLAYWIGEPLNREKRWRGTLTYFDKLFLVDSKDWIGELDEESEKKATLLPLSSTPKVFHPLDMDEDEVEKYVNDVVFVGLFRRERAKMIEPIKNYDFKIYGYGWDGAEKDFPWLSGRIAGPAQTEELNKIFNGAKISIGSLGMSFQNNLPTLTQRVFDIALAGGFQLSQWNPLTEMVFGDSVPLFRSTEEFAELLDYYTEHSEEREQFAKKAHAIALKNTWENRAEEAVKVFRSLL